MILSIIEEDIRAAFEEKTRILYFQKKDYNFSLPSHRLRRERGSILKKWRSQNFSPSEILETRVEFVGGGAVS